MELKSKQSESFNFLGNTFVQKTSLIDNLKESDNPNGQKTDLIYTRVTVKIKNF